MLRYRARTRRGTNGATWENDVTMSGASSPCPPLNFTWAARK